MYSIILENEFGKKERVCSEECTREDLDYFEHHLSESDYYTGTDWVVVNAFKMEG